LEKETVAKAVPELEIPVRPEQLKTVQDEKDHSASPAATAITKPEPLGTREAVKFAPSKVPVATGTK
jgi:hypothetical protein